MVTTEELRAEFNALVESLNGAAVDIANVPFGQPAQDLSLTWNPSSESVLLRLADSVNTFALFRANRNYGNPNKTDTPVLGIAGRALSGQGGRMAAFGGNPLAHLQPGNFVGTGFDTAMINVVRWLLGEEGSATATSALTPRIVTAQLPEDNMYVVLFVV